jgi:hypothetical protein
MIPSNVSTGRVEGRFIVGVQDGPDVDSDPDFIAAQGTIDFTASVPYLPNPTADPAPVTLLKTAIRGVLDTEGYLCTMLADGSPGVRGMRLVATDDPDLLVQNWTWAVAYRFTPVNGSTPAIAAHAIALPSDTTVDLTTAVKVPASPGVGLPQAEAAVLRAEAAATDSAESSATAEAAALDVVTRANAGEFKGDALTMGAVTAVAPGGTPTATLTGTSPNKVLNLGLVKGDPGNAFPTVATVATLPAATGRAGLAYYVTETKTVYLSDGTAWRAITRQRVDNTAGRAIYQWDDTAGREQIIYGDSGWRDISSLLPAGLAKSASVNTFTPALRRVGSTVMLNLFLDVTGAGLTSVVPVLPLGFRSKPAVSRPSSMYIDTFSTARALPATDLPWYLSSASVRTTAALPINSTIMLTTSWYTTENWPTTLPGVADGSIPSL